MAGFASIRFIVDATEAYGQSTYSTWRKSPTQVTTIGIWFDLSMSPGQPVPNYYAAAPLIAIRLARSTDGGLNHLSNVSPAYKYLRRLMVMTTTATALPMPMILCDYLLYYPFIDQSVTDPQIFDNTVGISRYTSGVGVQIMAVCVGAHSLAGGVQFTVSYTNSAGVAGRTSQTATLTTAQAVNGTLLTSERAVNGSLGPFITLQRGDVGVQSIQSVQMATADVGLMTLVLVKPIAQFSLRGIDGPVEMDYLQMCGLGMPRIVDDAYLNLICLPAGSLAATALHGSIETVWG